MITVGPIMIFIYLVVIIIAIAIDVSFANRMQRIAEAKGSKERYWAWCFWFPLFGALMVIALPDRANQIKSDKNELPPL